MTTNYHTPLTGIDDASAITFNTVFSALDSAITTLAGTIQNTISATLGEGVAANDAGYIDLSDGMGYLLDADASTPKAGVIRGFWTDTVISGGTATLQISGIMSGFSGLTARLPIYVSTSAGGLTQARPSPTSGGAQVAIMQMGIAISATEVYVNPLPIQYHKRDALVDDETLTVTHHPDANGYRRNVWAYITETAAGAEATGHSDSNQDTDVNLQGASDSLVVSETGAPLTVGKGGGGTAITVAQSFQLSNGGPLDTIKFTLAANLGSPTGDITWRICENNAGQPGTELASASMTPTPSSENTINVVGADRVTLSASTTYWLTLQADSVAGFSNSTGYAWDADSSGSYANGNAGFYSNSSWTNLPGYDTDFAILTEDSKTKLAQTFTLGSSTDIASVGLWLKKVGSPTGTATVRIETVSGGEPTGTLADAAASVTFAESTLGTSYDEKLLTFASEFTLASGTYAIVLSTDRSADASNYIVWGADGSSPSYAGGEMFNEQSSSWNAESMDAVFGVYEPGVVNPARVSVDWWSSAYADMVNRYGDGSGASLDDQTTFKCVRAAGFDDITVVVEIP